MRPLRMTMDVQFKILSSILRWAPFPHHLFMFQSFSLSLLTSTISRHIELRIWKSTLTYLLKSCIFRFPRSKYWPYGIKARPSCCLRLWLGSCPSTLTGGSVVATKTGSHMRRCISALVNLAHILAFKLLRLMCSFLRKYLFVLLFFLGHAR